MLFLVVVAWLLLIVENRSELQPSGTSSVTDIEQQHAPLPAKDNQGYMDNDTAADKLNTPIILAVHLVTPSIWNSPPSIPGSNLIVGDFEAIQHVETLTPRGEEFVQELLQELKDRFNRNQKYDVPFTESELRSLVSEAIVVDAEAQTATARILAASTAVMLHAGSEQYNEPNSITPKKVFRLLAEVCRSLVQDETQMVPALLAQFRRDCGFVLSDTYKEELKARHAATMPVKPQTYEFWVGSLPHDGVVTSDVHRRAVAAVAHLRCETCTGADGGEDDGSPLSPEELDLREAIRTCAVDLGLEPGLHDLRVADDPLRLCVEEAGAYDVSRVIVQLLP